ncbi:MAG: ABC transporter substrate-binding protein, partial [Natronosporangium sp.]
DVTFHDGSPVTVDDAVFTWQRLLDPDSGATSGALYQANIESVTAQDGNLVVRLKQPWPIFLSFVTAIHTKVVRKQVVEAAGDEYGNSVWSGTGPFKIDQWRRGEQVRLVKADNTSPQGTAYLDEIVYRTMPEASSRTAALLAGEIDVVYQPAFSDLAQFEGDDRFQVITAPSSTYTGIVFNTGSPLVNDARVRRALSYAIDRQALVDSFFYGYAAVAGNLFAPDHWAHDPQISVPFDPAAARALLAEVGYDEANPFALTMLVNNNDPIFVDQATAIQAFLQDIGVRLELRPTEYSALVGFMQGGPEAWPAEAPAAMTSLQPLRGTAYEFAYYLLGKDGPFNFNYFNKPEGAQNPELERQMAAAAELSDYIEAEREQARQLYAEISRGLIEDPPELRLNWWDLVNVTSTRVQDWVPANADNNLLAQVWLSA